jgi:hypothetical protein
MAGAAVDGTVTLVSLTMFQTHEWIFKPDVYFKCQGEERRGEERRGDTCQMSRTRIACISLLDKSLGT